MKQDIGLCETIGNSKLLGVPISKGKRCLRCGELRSEFIGDICVSCDSKFKYKGGQK